MSTVNVRYMVDDVDEAVAFYTKHLGFTVLSSAGSDRVIEEARALNPVSVDVVPVTLREIFLEAVASEN